MFGSQAKENFAITGTQSEVCVWSEISLEWKAGARQVSLQTPYCLLGKTMLILRESHRNSDKNKIEVLVCT